MLSPEKWRIVNELSATLGASEKARAKWKVRGVPPIWQIRLVRAAPNVLFFDDFSTAKNEAAKVEV